jgi:hypothetical protein
MSVEPDGGDTFQTDQHLPTARHRSSALPDSVADESAGNADESIPGLAAGSIEAAKPDPVGARASFT